MADRRCDPDVPSHHWRARLFGLSTVFWLFVLSRTPLSSAYLFVALGITMKMASGAFLFGEALPIAKLAGAT